MYRQHFTNWRALRMLTFLILPALLLGASAAPSAGARKDAQPLPMAPLPVRVPVVQHDADKPMSTEDYYDAVAAGLDDAPAPDRAPQPPNPPRVPETRPLFTAVRSESDLADEQSAVFLPRPGPDFADYGPAPVLKLSQKDFETKKVANFALLNQPDEQLEQFKPTAMGRTVRPLLVEGDTSKSSTVESQTDLIAELGIPPVAKTVVVDAATAQ